MSIDRLPPFSHDSEAAFLGSCLIDSRAIESGLEIGLLPEDFHHRDYANVWQGVVRLFDSRKAVDIVTLSDWLSEQGGVESPSSFVAQLLNQTPTSVNAVYYAQIIKDKSLRRHLISAASVIAALGYSENEDIETTMDKAESALKRAREKTPQNSRNPSPADIISRMENRKTTGIQTRLPALNAMTAGMVRGHIWVVGGFSSTGKSAFAVNLMDDVAKSTSAQMVASTEMPQEEYMLRLLALTSGVPSSLIRYGGMSLEQSSEYNRSRDFWKTSRIRVFDDLYSVTRIRRYATRVKEEIGLDVLFVDFIQNLNETGDEVKDARLASIRLQALAKELDCCIVILSQISNAQAIQQNETGAFGNYYAFKGSGAIKDAADVAIMLDRDRVNHPDKLNVNIVKNRHGPIGRVVCHMNIETGEVRQMTEGEANASDPNAGRKSKRIVTEDDDE